MSAARIPQGMAGSYSVAVVGKPLGPDVLAHQSVSQTREVTGGFHRGTKETYYVAACADDPGDADDAYLVSAAWADAMGVSACTEPACFPDA